jgi:glycosyltransferase involved in cell wall biosynthesis
MKDLKICLVSPLPPPYGGISNWTEMVLRYAVGREDVKLFIVDTAPRWRGIHNTSLLLRSIGGAVQLVRDVGVFITALMRNRVDLIHLTTSGHLGVIRDVLLSFLALIFKVPIVYHIRFGRLPELANSGSLEWKLIRMVMERAAKVVVIDGPTLRSVENHAPKVNVVRVPNCIDLADLPQVSSGISKNKIVLFVGWVLESKGVGELIEAWTRINPSGWRLEIIGPVEQNYRDFLLRRFQPDNVEFVGELPHSDTMERMAECELLVLPSYTEGFPNVVVEAMALRKAVVASAVGAIPEMLGEECGALVKSRDAYDLAHTLKKVLINPELRERYGKRAYAKVLKEYAVDVVFQTYLDIWSSVLALKDE